MKKENAMYLTLLKCDKKLEKNYNKQVKFITKHYKGSERDAMLQNLDEQHYASLLALNMLINNKKEKLEKASVIA
jgi:hypothetical protein